MTQNRKMEKTIIMLILIQNSYSIDLNLTICPDKSQWNMRAVSLCNKTTPAYFCLLDDNEKLYKEFCRREPEAQTPGYKFVLRGGLDSIKCEKFRYQPFKLTTYGYSHCIFEKSKCIEEGQIVYDNGTATSNRFCRCDYTNSYNFIKKTRTTCFCDPTEEDCSCYKMNCTDGQVVSPDYLCIDSKRFSENNHCSKIKRSEIRGKQDNGKSHITTSSLKVKFRSTLKAKQSIAIIIISVIMLTTIMGIAIAGVCIFHRIIHVIGASTEKTKIENEFKEEDKIRLLKHYQEIVDNLDEIVLLGNLKKNEEMYSKTQKARALLNILIQSDRREYQSFLDALRRKEGLKELADKIEKTEVTDKESIREFDSLLIDPVPINLKELHERQLTEWIECQDQIVTTSAIDKLYSDLQHDSRITIIGPRGSGKTSTLRAAAIRLMTNDDFEIIPCTEPSEIISCLRTYCKQIFVFDDVCETTSRAVSFLEEWNKRAALIEKMIQTPDNKNRKKILIAVDSFSYHMMDMINKSFDISSFSSVFEMKRNSLSEKEAKDIAKKHRNTDNTLYEYINNIFFYPELCRRYGFYMKIEHCVHIESLLYEIIDDFLKVLVKDDEVFLASMLLFVIHGKSINLSMLHEKLDRMSDVIRFKKDSLTISAISARFGAMIASDMYIDSDENLACYSVINDELFMGIVSFFYHNYFNEILEMSTDDSLSNMLQEWKTHIEHRKIKLPHHNTESMANYFDFLSSRVKSQKQMQSYREKFRTEKKPE